MSRLERLGDSDATEGLLKLVFEEAFGLDATQNLEFRREVTGGAGPTRTWGATLGSYPAPFVASTTIVVEVDESVAAASLRVYDTLGRQVAVLLSGALSAGSHSVLFDATELPSGLYVARFTDGARVVTHDLLLVR